MMERRIITKDELECLYLSGIFNNLDYEYIIPSITDEIITLYQEGNATIAVLIDGFDQRGNKEIFYFEVSNDKVGNGYGTWIMSEYLQEHGVAEVISITTSIDFWTKSQFNPSYSDKIFKLIKEDIDEEGDSIYLLQVRLSK